jgi:hypothetical protein
MTQVSAIQRPRFGEEVQCCRSRRSSGLLTLREHRQRCICQKSQSRGSVLGCCGKPVLTGGLATVVSRESNRFRAPVRGRSMLDPEVADGFRARFETRLA